MTWRHAPHGVHAPGRIQTRHRQRDERSLAARGDRGEDGVALGTDGQSVTRRFDVAASEHPALGILKRRANAEIASTERTREWPRRARARSDRSQVIHEVEARA